MLRLVKRIERGWNFKQLTAMAENMKGKSLNMAENMPHAHRSLGEGGGKPLTSAVIIVASGSGQRAGFDKLLADLNGHPVLEWSIVPRRSILSVKPQLYQNPPH